MRRLALPLFVALAASACNEDSTFTPGPSGSLSATYTGDLIGSLNAEGPYRNKLGSTYALAYDLGASREGALRVGAEQYDELAGTSIAMTLSQATVGEYSFSPGCDFDNARCAYGLFEYDNNVSDAGLAKSYDMIGGTLRITSVQGERVQGTFALQLQRFDPPTGELIAGTEVTVTGGTFDVPVVIPR